MLIQYVTYCINIILKFCLWGFSFCYNLTDSLLALFFYYKADIILGSHSQGHQQICIYIHTHTDFEKIRISNYKLNYISLNHNHKLGFSSPNKFVCVGGIPLFTMYDSLCHHIYTLYCLTVFINPQYKFV